jgi:hypothetical protein
VALLPEFLITAELNPRPAFGLRASHSGALKIVSTVLDVRAQLLFHLSVDLPAMKKCRDAGAKPFEEFHTSSDSYDRDENLS